MINDGKRWCNPVWPVGPNGTLMIDDGGRYSHEEGEIKLSIEKNMLLFIQQA